MKLRWLDAATTTRTYVSACSVPIAGPNISESLAMLIAYIDLSKDFIDTHNDGDLPTCLLTTSHK